MSKFALKHSFYNTENTNPKQDAGFIEANVGLANELVMLDLALEHNIPALLVDLTNTIRHGDVCLMGESDPCLIEVKTSKKLDSRGKKQKRSLEKLRTFYKTDKCEGLRGYPQLRRHAYKMPERTYVRQINECITEAVKNGYGLRQPEQGLHYVVIMGDWPDVRQVLGTLNLRTPWVYFLNDAKNDRTCAPYQPFILTIEDKEHLWKFIQGKFIVMVLIEPEALCQIVLGKGNQARCNWEDKLCPLRVELPENGGMFGISEHMLARIWMEFVSPEWIVSFFIETFEAHKTDYDAAPSAQDTLTYLGGDPW